jgi:phage-related tail fiber protein
MPAAYYTLLTNIGAADLTNAQAFGYHVPLTHLAVGDGDGAPVLPTEGMTALVNERFRIGINSISASTENPNWLIIEAVIPANIGGLTIREIGLIGGLNPENIASTVPGNKLLAVGNFPETYKPLLAEGAAKDLVIRMIVRVANASLVELKIDPSVVIATQRNLAQAIEAHRTSAHAHPNLYAPLAHVEDTMAHPDIRALLAATANTRMPVLRTGIALPTENIGPIWHDDYNSIMTWQVFNANGANYTGYASILVGDPILSAQPTPRKGYVASGSNNLSRTAYAALRGWAMHNGIMVASGVWAAGTVAMRDNADGTTFTVYDLRGEFIRAWDNGRGVDPGRAFGSFQGDAIRNITGEIQSRPVIGATGAVIAGYNAFNYLINQGSPGASTLAMDSGVAASDKTVFDASRVVPTAYENRSRNVALPVYIKF